ncbi:MAG: hypothetical protein HEQ13_09325 [Dolichospermum sp. DEX189]|uniref:Uncharacterized protein n=1 Tax=Aphanizomenon flos-aquae FACHB-1040 TaxID=2692887 RepID=A0ABR8C201_APHFL|nr:hypothetical protein [Aphanizomenon flos-aquae]MBD2280872.1 hypothetical protein [Aphanizomenon flos-aquae FACHB-1040]MBO1069544.1 hypothetical protein [Dolichospermum sp. DEX189]
MLDTKAAALPESSLGNKTGKTMNLPNGTIVYEQELIVCRASDCTGLGRGMHRGFVHVDWRAGGRVVFDYPFYNYKICQALPL